MSLFETFRVLVMEKNKMSEFREGGFGPREMHKATCAECGKECEVPFKPSGDRPVYCQDCYKAKRPKRF